jgi:hypothetical protein
MLPDSRASLPWKAWIILEYMGERGPSTTRAKTSTSTWAAFALSSARAQASTVAPEVSASSTQHDVPSRDVALTASGYLKCALHIADPLGARQSAVRWRARDSTSPHNATRARPCDGTRELPGLVVAAAKAPPPVSRYWNQHVGVFEQFLAAPRHPAAHGGRKTSAVLVFERVNQGACDIVIRISTRARP